MRVSFVVVLSLLLVVAMPPAYADVLPAPRRLAPEQWATDGLTIGHVGHASVLLKMDGTLLLTDPTFFERIGVGIGPITLGPERIIAPALSLDRLPTSAGSAHSPPIVSITIRPADGRFSDSENVVKRKSSKSSIAANRRSANPP